MTSKQRVLKTFNREKTDRVPIWCGASPEFIDKAMKTLNISNEEDLFVRFHDDFRRVYSKYVGPKERSGSVSIFGVTHDGIGCGQPVTHPLADATVEEIENYAWPTADWIDVSHIKQEALNQKEYAILGGEWCPFFHDAIDLLGMENLLIKMYEEPEVVQAVLTKIVDYYVQASEKIFKAAKGAIDIFFIGNDFGSQTGPMIGKELFDIFIFPQLSRLASLGHAYGLKVQLHCCGSYTALMPSIIKAGIDAVQGLQAITPDMQIENLVEKFSSQIILNGGIDSILYLINGTKEDAIKETKRYLKATASTGGYILSASHDYLLEETDVLRVVAMYDTAYSNNL